MFWTGASGNYPKWMQRQMRAQRLLAALQDDGGVPHDEKARNRDGTAVS